MQVRVSAEIGGLLDVAAAISVRHGKYYVGVEHLFEAVAERGDLLPKSFPEGLGRELAIVAERTRTEAWRGTPPEVSGDVYYTPRCAATVNEAARLAERLRSGQAGVGHLLLAILSDAHALPSRVMDRLGIDRKSILERLRSELMGNGGARPARAGPAPASGPSSEGPKGPAPIDVSAFTRDLTEAAREGKLEPAIGRDREIMEVVEVLARKGKHNVILVGEAGVGKTKIVEGLALEAAAGKLEAALGARRILELNVAGLMSGTQYRGAFEDKVLALLRELEAARDTVLFIDEVHLIMGAGSTEGDGMDLANLLKPALGRGELRCIGATTLAEYRKFIGKDPAIERRFQMVRVEPLTPDATLEVLLRLKPSLERHHDVRISAEALKAAVSLTERYLPNRQFPDKAIDALDQACARSRIKAAMGKMDATLLPVVPGAERKIRPHDLRRVVSQMAAVPIEEITAEERLRLTDLDRRLRARIIGQDEAVTKAAAAVKKSRAGLSDPNRPDAVMLFLGPTGVGKTQLAKELARAAFGSADHLLTFDMSEYVEAHSVSRLIGAPPGYVGSEEEGRLTGAVQNTPFSIVLFDEIEKAHPQIFDVFLPILDEGRLRDSRGKVVSFRNTMIIFTSNVGAECLERGGGEEAGRELMDALRQHFRPEFINRIDEIVPFYPLLFEDVRSILKMLIDGLRMRLREKDIGVRMYQRAYEYLAEKGYSREFGARELRRAVERYVADPISEKLLAGEFARGDMIDVLCEGDVLIFRKGEPSSRKAAS